MNGEPLLERDAELRWIDAALRRGREGRGEVLLIEGPAGIGKSMLLREARELAGAGDTGVLAARATEIEREYPFGVVRQLFEPALRAGTDRAALFSGAAALAERVLGDVAGQPDASEEDSRFATLHGLYWLLSNLAERQPLLLCVDDVQWADEPSQRFAAFLAPRLEDLPVTLALALRTGEPVGDALSVITGDATTRHLRPAALSTEAVGELLARWLGAAPDAHFTRAAHQAVRGNPFLLRLLADELRSERVEPTARAVERLHRVGPAGLSRTVVSRLARLAPGAPRLARAAAVLGDHARAGHAIQLSGLEGTAADRARDDLVAAGIMQRGEHLTFVHPVVRNAIYQDIGPGERSRLHGAAAGLLRAASAPPEQAASHLLHTDPAADPRVVNSLSTAARAAMRKGAPKVAAVYLERALAEPPPEPATPELLLELGTAEARTGEPAARQHLARAVELSPDPRSRVHAVLELAQVMAHAGEFTQAASQVLAVRDAVGDRKELTRPLEMLLLVESVIHVEVRRMTGGLLTRARNAVDQLGSRAPRGLHAIVGFDLALVDGTASQVAEIAERALAGDRLLEEQGAESPTVYFAAAALALAGRIRRAERHLGIAIEDARRRGSARGFAFASAIRAWVRYLAGELSGAEADARACVELVPGSGWPVCEAAARSALADTLVERGEPAADAGLERFAELERQAAGSVTLQLMRLSRARVRLAEGDPAAATAELAACADWEAGYGAHNGSWVAWRELAALAHARIGDGDATGLAEDATARARRFGAPHQLGVALLSHGLTRPGDDGIDLLREAVAALAGSEARLEYARALVEYGARLRREGHPTDARKPLQEGLELAHGCGAKTVESRALDELTRAGARPRHPLDTAADTLTPSERRVAELAAEGLSNREIAQALFLSARTVETHLAHAYRKLGITSRTQLLAHLPPPPI